MPEPRGTSHKNVVAFNSGEWSPFLDSRADNQKYDNACRELTNVTILPYGGVERRGGFEYIAGIKPASTWATSTSYSVGAIVDAKETANPERREYRCLIAHTSGTFDTDIAAGNWVEVTSRARVIGFNYSTTTSYIIEIGNDGTGYMRFFSAGAPVINTTVDDVLTSGTPPWAANEVNDIQFIQINDVMYMTHPNHPVQKLSRLTATTFKIEAVVFDKPAFLDVNATSTTLTSSVTAVGATGTLTASASTFTANHVGSYWKLIHDREASQVNIELNSAKNSAVLTDVVGEWNFRTTNRWDGIVKLQRYNTATATWDTIREFESADGDRNVDVTDEQLSPADFRINYAGTAKGSSGGAPFAYLEILDQEREGVVRVDSFTSDTIVNITVIDKVENTNATDLWAEGAWSGDQGYPRAVSLFEQRVIYGGTSKKPQTVWGSKVGDFENFDIGTNDDDAYSYTLASTEQNTIQWLSGQNKLLIGTIGGEWTMGGDGEKPLTPSNVAVFRQSTYGSAYVQGKMISDSVFYVQRNGRKVREMIESETSVTSKYVSPDLTIFSEHITEGGINQSFFTQQPHVVFWGVTGDGNLIGMTFERDQNVVGWFKFKSGDVVERDANGNETSRIASTIESAASVYGGLNDEIWAVIKRTVNGSTVRYVERISTNVVYGYSGSGSVNSQLTDKDYSFYVDSGVWYDGVATGTFTGLAHLNGESVDILADGAVYPAQTVSGGSITLPNSATASKCAIGLGYESVVQPMKLEADSRLGGHMATVKRVRQAVVSFYKSLGVSWATNWDENDDGTTDFTQFPFRDTTDVMDSSPPLFTGCKEITLLSRHDKDGNLIIKQTQPLPMTILKIVYKLEVTGR